MGTPKELVSLAPIVPFYKSPDWDSAQPTHCVPAVAKMVLAHFLPDKEYTWAELEGFTHKVPRKATTTIGITLSLNQIGLKASQITDFDFASFASEGISYIKQRYSGKPHLIDEFRQRLDVEHEQSLARDALAINPGAFINRPPTLQDLEKYVQSPEALVICQVNARKLKGEEGNVGHFVLLIPGGIRDNEVIFHDPGGSTHPPEAYRRVPLDMFMKVWQGESGVDGAMIVVEKSIS